VQQMSDHGMIQTGNLVTIYNKIVNHWFIHIIEFSNLEAF
jgi:hypothetical protein